MNKIKNLVYVVAVVFGIGFLDGMFEIGFSDNAYVLLGLIDIGAIVWLIILVNKE